MSRTNEWRKGMFDQLPADLRALWTNANKVPYKQTYWKAFQKVIYEAGASLRCQLRRCVV